MAELTLTSGDLASMRSVVSSFLPGTAIIQTLSQVSDGQGGWTDTYSAASTVAARMSPVTGPRGGEELGLAGRIAEVQKYTLTVPSTTTLTESGRVVFNGATYEVVEVQDRTPWHLDHRALMVLVD